MRYTVKTANQLLQRYPEYGFKLYKANLTDNPLNRPGWWYITSNNPRFGQVLSPSLTSCVEFAKIKLGLE